MTVVVYLFHFCLLKKTKSKTVSPPECPGNDVWLFIAPKLVNSVVRLGAVARRHYTRTIWSIGVFLVLNDCMHW